MKQGILFITSLLIAFTLSAQPAKQPFILGVVDKVESKVLSESRTLNIYLPDDYDTSKATYPVIYLLDGSANEDFIHIVGIVQFLNMIDTLPKCIVVGMANTNRRHDFTHPTTVDEHKKLIPAAGGSEQFMNFIEKELQPYIEKRYRTSGKRTIIGQSLGGLLATEIFLNRPRLFDDYIIVSPSLWWDKESLLSKAPTHLTQQANNGKRIYLSVGTEGDEMENDAKVLAGMIRQSNKNIQLFYQPLPEENHLTILHNSVYKALEILNQ